MTDQQTQNNTGFQLPQRLVTSVDMARVIRELQMLDDWLLQASLRSGGKSVKPPKTSATLEELASLNGVSLLEKDHREQLMSALKAFQDAAPKVHMSFAVEPSAGFLLQMIAWLRANIHPMVLLEVGLQPTLAAGCVLRTKNKLFDLSLRHRFVDSKPLLAESIAKFQLVDDSATPAAPAAPAVEAVVAPAAAPEQPQTAGAPAPAGGQS